MERRAVDQLVVVDRVLASVIDQGELLGLVRTVVGTQALKAGDELVDHRSELGDIGQVAGIGVGDERDAAIGGHNKAQTNYPKVISLLLRVSSLCDRGPRVRRVDIGREVRHVQHQPGEIDVEDLDHGGDDPPLDLFELGSADRIHRIPKAPVIECSW
jgi:hypothetical protein